jgi:hypothetical protein
MTAREEDDSTAPVASCWKRRQVERGAAFSAIVSNGSLSASRICGLSVSGT